MRVDRREFVRLGLAGSTGFLASCGRSTPPANAVESASTLFVALRGLLLVEETGKSVVVHLLDHEKAHLMEHQPFLSVPAALIDSTSTVPSIPDQQNRAMRLVDLRGKEITLDTGTTAVPDLNINKAPIGSNPPATDADWQSSLFAAWLNTLCKATKITDASAFFGTMTLDHGYLHSTLPNDPVGRQTTWVFTDTSTSNVVAKQRLTDTLVCDVPVKGKKATFTIGTQALVLNLEGDAQVLVRHLPPPGTPGICKTTNPCVDHLASFYEVVDASVKPTAEPSQGDRGTIPQGAEPDYCPLAAIKRGGAGGGGNG